MPNSSPHVPHSAEDASANDNSTVTVRFQATPIDVAPLKRSEPYADDFPVKQHTAGVAAGRLPEDVYANTLPSWRAALRRKCVAVVEWESEVIGKLQVRPFPPPPLSSRSINDEEEESLMLFLCFCRRVSGRPG
jgi:hypothetical protein